MATLKDPSTDTPETPTMPPNWSRPGLTNIQVSPDPNVVSGLGKYLGPVAQFGAVGLMGIILWNMQRDNAAQTRESHADTMIILNKALDRLESNQTQNHQRFETIQQDATRRGEKSDEKFEKMATELQTGRKEMLDKLDKMISKMPDK